MSRGPFAISDRSGFRYPIDEMRLEWTGALVHRSEYEEKHPQLEPFRDFGDPAPVQDARPDTGFGATAEPITVVRFIERGWGEGDWGEGVWGGYFATGNTLKLALYTETLPDSTTAYTTTDEVSGTGYTAGGAILSGVTISSEAFGLSLTASDPEWEASIIDGAVAGLIYEASSGTAVAILDWRYAVSSASGTFTVDMPAASVATRAIPLGT